MNRLELMDDVVSCEACERHAACTAPVFMVGDDTARIAIIGDAPTAEDDAAGAPFQGDTGRFLIEKIAGIGIDPTTTAIFNTVACSDGGLEWEHINACNTNKQAQLDYADPQFVLLLGPAAVQAEVPELRKPARPWTRNGRVYFGTVHPAAGRRNDGVEARMDADLAVFKEIIEGNWQDHIPDGCGACDEWAMWWQDSGLGWCEQHIPNDERARFDQWMAQPGIVGR